MAKANYIRDYADADSAGRVDFICMNYSNFLGIIESCTEGIRYMIEAEKAYNHREQHGDLGIRVQSGRTSNPTQEQAINNIIIRDAIVTCDFSGGVLEGTDSPDRYVLAAITLADMRSDYQLFNQQLESLRREEREFFVAYLMREQTVNQIADAAGITYESAVQKAFNIKKRIKLQMVRYLDGVLL